MSFRGVEKTPGELAFNYVAENEWRLKMGVVIGFALVILGIIWLAAPFFTLVRLSGIAREIQELKRMVKIQELKQMIISLQVLKMQDLQSILL
jgi:hypothetical protein